MINRKWKVGNCR